MPKKTDILLDLKNTHGSARVILQAALDNHAQKEYQEQPRKEDFNKDMLMQVQVWTYIHKQHSKTNCNHRHRA